MPTRSQGSGVRFAGTRPWPAITADLMRPNQIPVIAVVAFVGKDAQDVMPLTAGDILICDASESRISAGTVSAAALVAYARDGVEVRSLPGLHAKVISGGKYAWVGSANASTSSSQGLCEASVRVTGPQSSVVRVWAEERLAESVLLTTRNLAALAKLPAPKTPSGPRYRTRLTVPVDLKSLYLVALGQSTTNAVVAAAEKEARSVKSQTGSGGGALAWFVNRPDDPPSFKAGNWVIAQRSLALHVKLAVPAEVIHVSDHGEWNIVWLKAAKVAQRPTIRDLPGSLPEWVVRGSDSTRLLRGGTLAELLALYGPTPK